MVTLYVDKNAPYKRPCATKPVDYLKIVPPMPTIYGTCTFSHIQQVSITHTIFLSKCISDIQNFTVVTHQIHTYRETQMNKIRNYIMCNKMGMTQGKSIEHTN